MIISAQVRESLISNFRAELNEQIQIITDGLLALEQSDIAEAQRQETLETIFRAAHSLKGAARAVGVTAVEQLAHALEDVLDAMRHEAITPTSDVFTACYGGLDAIQAVHAAYEAGADTPPAQTLQALSELASLCPGPEDTPQAAGTTEAAISSTGELVERAPPPPTVSPVQRSDETIRVSVRKLDALMAQLSELFVTKIRAEQRLVQIRQVQEIMARWQKEWFAARAAYGRLVRGDGRSPAELIGGNGRGERRRDARQLLNFTGVSQERLREVNALMNTLTRQYADDTMHMALAIDALEEEIKRTRMLPLSTITGPFSRMVRDLAHEAGKEAALHISGGDTELDKYVLEQIKDPLIHLLRNAIDHGIEPPEQRVTAGKPRRGAITLTAEQTGNDVVISVTDDGAGLDLAAIRAAVARQGREAQTLTETELQEVIFSPGISTSRIITDISGRGVGLDVVRRNVEALHGRIDLDSTSGAGATFTLALPLTLTSSRGLLVYVSDELFAIPFNAVERILQVNPRQIVSLEGRDTIRHNGRPITLVRLNDVLELPRGAAAHEHEDGRMPALILGSAERRMGFVVDELVGEQEMVIKGLGKQLSRVGGIAGATVLGSGEVVLILNVADLIKMAARGKHGSVLAEVAEVTLSAAAQVQRRILVVDDSITTRTLEKNILEAAGYAVELATDGQEAWSVIASGDRLDLIVADIAMPRMDGFELTRRVKGETRMADVPVVLVTSLDSPEDKAQGIEVGADAYIVKSRFDQNNLLETIEQLISA